MLVWTQERDLEAVLNRAIYVLGISPDMHRGLARQSLVRGKQSGFPEDERFII